MPPYQAAILQQPDAQTLAKCDHSIFSATSSAFTDQPFDFKTALALSSDAAVFDFQYACRREDSSG
jgi:hypothetical protein